MTVVEQAVAAMEQAKQEILKLRQKNAVLLEALKPFAAIGATGFVGSGYEHGEDYRQVLYHHASGLAVTLQDFRNAVEAVQSEGQL